jgi:CRP/FNR family cyclic AMP-dependent transcriptional regulator
MTSIHLFDHSQNRQTYAPGDVVFAQGDHGDVMHAVVEGQVDILVGGRLVETTGPGGIIGEMALIEDVPRSATAQARTEAVLVAVGKPQFLFMVQEHPTFALMVMRVIADRLRRMGE